MTLRIRLAVAAVAGLLLTAGAVTPSNAHCWWCDYESGVNQWYCASTAGFAYASCAPVWNEVCSLGASGHYCETDGCSCIRYPDGRSASRTVPIASTLGVLLFKLNADVPQSVSTVASVPLRIDVGDGTVTAEVVNKALAARAPQFSVQSLVGYTATTSRGYTTSRVLGN